METKNIKKFKQNTLFPALLICIMLIIISSANALTQETITDPNNTVTLTDEQLKAIEAVKARFELQQQREQAAQRFKEKYDPTKTYDSLTTQTDSTKTTSTPINSLNSSKNNNNTATNNSESTKNSIITDKKTLNESLSNPLISTDSQQTQSEELTVDSDNSAITGKQQTQLNLLIGAMMLTAISAILALTYLHHKKQKTKGENQ